MVSSWCKERSHSGLVQMFAKHPGFYSPREFESLPLRHRGVAQLAEHSTPNRAVGGSSPLAPAAIRKPPEYGFRRLSDCLNQAPLPYILRAIVKFHPPHISAAID